MRLGTTVEQKNSIGMPLVLIPPGEFLLGSTDEQIAAGSKPPRKPRPTKRLGDASRSRSTSGYADSPALLYVNSGFRIAGVW